MIATKPSPVSSAGASTAAVAPLNLHARLEAATEALLKTRDQVIAALDHHLSELDTLRRSLAQAEKPLAASPLPGSSAAAVEAPRYFDRAPQPIEPNMPMLTQVLWPSKHAEPAVAVPARVSEPPAVTTPSSPLVAYTSMESSTCREVTMDPELEKATLEELNTALAYAFSHVSNPRNAAPAGRTWQGNGGANGSSGR